MMKHLVCSLCALEGVGSEGLRSTEPRGWPALQGAGLGLQKLGSLPFPSLHHVQILR